MKTWQEVAGEALARAYPETRTPADLGEAIKAAGVLAWSREGLSRWLRHQSDLGAVEHVAFKQYRAVPVPRSQEAESMDQPGKYAAPQVKANLREDPDLGLIVSVHAEYSNSKGVPYERRVPGLEAALAYIGAFWRNSAPGRDAGTPPASGVEWGYRYRLVKSPSGPGAGRVSERSSASRAEAEEDVAAFLEEPGKWEAEVTWRTAEVKPGEWHSLRLTVTDTLEKAAESQEDEEDVPPQVLSDLLSLTAGTVIPPEVIATWTRAEREEATAWAAAEHLHASDHDDVKRVQQPEFVRRAAEICGSPAMAQLAIEQWTAFLETAEKYPAAYADTALSAAVGAARDAITGMLCLLGDDALEHAARLAGERE